MRLFIVHFHFRPGGVRRVLELAAPHVISHSERPIREVVLVGGEAPPETWLTQFRHRLKPLPVQVEVDRAAAYLSERHCDPLSCATHLEQLFKRLFHDAAGDIVWAHNQGLGRNLLLTRALIEATARAGLTLVLHHHDWWFDNRWQRWPEIQHSGFAGLPQVAATVFPTAPHLRHVTINHQDNAILHRHLPRHTGWLPNPADEAPAVPAARVKQARQWFRQQLGSTAPVWLLPVRLVRRKNIAEAILLTRWLRPEAWLVTTGAPSSKDEEAYAHKLQRAAARHHWKVRLAMLANSNGDAPAVPALIAASETLLLTSIQEGFGLPFLEATAAQRPLIARRLRNISPDLARFGFEFPQSYDDVLVPPSLFDWEAEVFRQTQLFHEWKQKLPRSCRALAQPPPLLIRKKGPVAFSNLTLTAQLEILTVPVEESWTACEGLNPRIASWRPVADRLAVSGWPQAAGNWLSGEAYGRRFRRIIETQPNPRLGRTHSRKLQSEFIAAKLKELHPLMLSTNT